jgi:sulfonate transport system permease protein
LWEYFSRSGAVPSYLLPAPSQIAAAIWEMGKTGELWSHLGITVYRIFLGFILGTAFAIVFGALTGFYKTAYQLFDPLLQAFRSIPSLAWVPLFILWMGITEASKVTLIAVGTFFPVYLNLVSGIHGVDRKLIEVGKIYRLTTFQLIKRIMLPAALPSFLTGLRGGLGLGWMFVVAAELMGASKGLGFLLVFGQNTSSPELIIASIVLFAVLGKLTDALLQVFENKALHWQDNLAKRT